MVKTLDELAYGTVTQRAALVALRGARVFETLRAFTPVLAGTVPLDLDSAGSDFDVICEATDLKAFGQLVQSTWPRCTGEFKVEIFAQATPVEEQYAVLHLRVERKLLELGGEPARRAIRDLKAAGLKTEPAFAKYFDIAGDPYDSLARLAKLSIDDLRRAVAI